MKEGGREEEEQKERVEEWIKRERREEAKAKER